MAYERWMRFDESNSACSVITRRAGLLGAVGHDLEINVGSFVIDVGPSDYAIRGRFFTDSLRVLGALKGDSRVSGGLSDADKRQIEATLRESVLKTRAFPEARFESTTVARVADGYRIRGSLWLCGVRGEIECTAGYSSERLTAEVRLHQPAFGIEPYRAFGGALRVKPDVMVRVSVPRPPVLPSG